MGITDLPKYPNKVSLELVKWIILTVIICLGIFVRIIDLSTHFSHSDDNSVAYTILETKKSKDVNEIRKILIEKAAYPRLKILKRLDELGLLDDIISLDNKFKFSQFFIIPLRFTYAPLQFIVTPFLISKTQPYQEILFWGRFPSFFFNVLALILLVPFYQLFKKEKYFQYLILSLVLISFSWENIIYSKHMSPYSIGVLGALLVLYLLLHRIKHVDFSLQKLLLNSLFLAIISHAQYQILFFIPAYYLSLFYYYANKTSEKIKLIRNFVFSGILYILLISPMYFLFLQHLTDRKGSSYGMYAGKEFVLTVPNNVSCIEKFQTIISFFYKNSMTMFQSNLTFLPESHSLFTLIMFGLAALFVVGILSFITTKCDLKKIIGLFFFITALIWTILIFKQKLSMAPTRHNLVLLPYQAIIISEGLGYLFTKIKILNINHFFSSIFRLSFSIMIIFLFFTYFQEITKERRDTYNEKEIFNLLKRHKVNTVISYRGATNFALMLLNKKNVLSHFNNTDWQSYLKETSYDRIAFISNHFPLNKEIFDELKQSINSKPESHDVFNNYFPQYKRIFSKEINSNAQIDFSKRLKTNSNSFYFYILVKPKSN